MTEPTTYLDICYDSSIHRAVIATSIDKFDDEPDILLSCLTILDPNDPPQKRFGARLLKDMLARSAASADGVLWVVGKFGEVWMYPPGEKVPVEARASRLRNTKQASSRASRVYPAHRWSALRLRVRWAGLHSPRQELGPHGRGHRRAQRDDEVYRPRRVARNRAGRYLRSGIRRSLRPFRWQSVDAHPTSDQGFHRRRPMPLPKPRRRGRRQGHVRRGRWTHLVRDPDSGA